MATTKTNAVPIRKKNLQILRNMAKMLERRGLGDSSDAIAEVLLDNYEESQYASVYNNVRVKIVNESVKNLNKTVGLLSYLQQVKPGESCLLVVNNIFYQPFKALVAMGNVEVFWTFELFKDLYSNILIPPHRLLSLTEKEKVMREYQVRSKEISRMDRTDFVCRYMGFKVGDLIEIERPSVTSGISVAYRVVTNCSWESMFR
jgi:DNA-directed RNA polymerase subunit H